MDRQHTAPNHSNHSNLPPAPAINLGHDPGSLLAALPALLGFCPENSLIVIGLAPTNRDHPDSPQHARSSTAGYTLGPVIRCDLGKEALPTALRTLMQATVHATITDMLAVVVGSVDNPAHLAVITDVLSYAHDDSPPRSFDVHSVVVTPAIRTGERFVDLLWDTTGVIANVTTHVLTDLSHLNHAVNLGRRCDMEMWLDRLPVSSPRRTYLPASTTTVAGIHESLEVCLDIEAGRRRLDMTSRRNRVLDTLDAVAAHPAGGGILLVFATGTALPILRDLLAAAARRACGIRRWRAMYLTALCLAANDEGALAFHTLNRIVDEIGEHIAAADPEESMSLLSTQPELAACFEQAVTAAKSHYEGVPLREYARAVDDGCAALSRLRMLLGTDEAADGETSETPADPRDNLAALVHSTTIAGPDRSRLSTQLTHRLAQLNWTKIAASRCAPHHPKQK